MSPNRKKSCKVPSWLYWRTNKIWQGASVLQKSIKRLDWTLLRTEPSKYSKLPRQRAKDWTKRWTGCQMHCRVENDQHYVRIIHIQALQGDQSYDYVTLNLCHREITGHNVLFIYCNYYILKILCNLQEKYSSNHCTFSYAKHAIIREKILFYLSIRLKSI